MCATQKFIQAKKTKLSGSGVTATATSIGLNFFTTPDGTEITTSELGTTNYGTLEPGTSKEEIISFTGVTQNGDGTATLTGVTRGLGFTTPYTAVAGNRQSHAGNTVFVLSNNPQMYDDMSSNVNDETITGKFTFPGGGDADAPVSGTVYAEPTDDLEYASKKYIDDIAIAGSPKATEAVYGIAKLSSAAASPTEPVVLNNEEVSATSAANKVVKANASGKIATDFISDGTSSGLEAGVGDGTQVKVKTSGGITKDADGLSVDTTIVASKILADSIYKKTLVAGEDIVAGNAIAVGDGTSIYTNAASPSNDTAVDSCYGTRYQAESFTTDAKARTITSISLRLNKVGGIAGNSTVAIYAGTGGAGAHVPTGASLATVTFANSTIVEGSPSMYNFVLSSPLTITPSTVYVAVLACAGGDSTHRFDWYGTNTNVYSGGNQVCSTDAGANWTAINTLDLGLSVYGLQTVAGNAYKASALIASIDKLTNFIGFATESKSAGQNVVVQHAGINANQTGLTNVVYYLSDTYGAIATSAGSQTKKVGIGVAATELLIKNDN